MAPDLSPDVRPVLDVGELPSLALDTRHPIWWGNTLLLAIETSSVALLLLAYFYLRKNFEHWPPPQVDRLPSVWDPVPKLGPGTLNLVLMLASLVPAVALDRLARKRVQTDVEVGEARGGPGHRVEPAAPPRTFSPYLNLAILLTGLTAIASVVRCFEFPAIRFGWSANAYASIVWTILGIHLLYLLMTCVEFGLIVVWVWREGLKPKFASDATLAAFSWYWTVAVWVLFYLVVYVYPRVAR